MKLAVVSLLRRASRQTSRQAMIALSSLWLLGTMGCAGSPSGDALQRSLEADPQLQDQISLGGQETTAREVEITPDSTVVDTIPGSNDTATEPNTVNPDVTASANSQVPQPGDRDFIGPVIPDDWVASAGTIPQTSPTLAPTLANVSEDLRPYVADWLALGIGPATFQPNQTITRAEYAAWLFEANNKFYSDQAAKRIRPASATSTQAFQDVPPTHPNYEAIQGLAEAGLIPSALTGNSTAVTFNPGAPLTREVLVLWKVPLDSRTPLPTATVDAVKATWGFQDAAEVEPLALRAVLEDHQNGDFANILRAFGYTTLFQPQKAVTQAEAAAALWRFGGQTEGISVKDLLEPSVTPLSSVTSPVGTTPQSE